MGVNMIITCEHSECQYCFEGECGKDAIMLDDKECLAVEENSNRMTVNDILTPEGIDADFMHWLWDEDRQTYTLILLGHVELITDELVQKYEATK